MRLTARSGGVRMRMQPVEAETIGGLLNDLVRALGPDGLDAADPVAERLFPSGYRDDAEAATAFRELTESSLRTERVERAQQCREELAAGATSRHRIELDLDAAAAQRWTQVLNDLRLALGTRLDVGEDSVDPAGLDPDDPDAMSYAVYAFLTAVQDQLVRALMR